MTSRTFSLGTPRRSSPARKQKNSCSGRAWPAMARSGAFRSARWRGVVVKAPKYPEASEVGQEWTESHGPGTLNGVG